MNSAALLDNLRVVLVATRNPLNIGAAARAMSNFGCTHLRLVNPYDPAYREAVSAVGAAPILLNAEQFSTVAEAVADCALVVGTTAAGRRELHHQLCTLESAAPIILHHLATQHSAHQQLTNAKLTRPAVAPGKIEVARKKIRGKRTAHAKTARAPLVAKSAAPASESIARNRVALLFGSEKTGLSNEDLSHCHWLLRIPTREAHRSMNLGQAVAVCLYELVRDPKAATKFSRALEKAPPATAGERARNKKAATRLAQVLEAEAPATAGELERFTAVLTEALSLSGFLDRRTVADADDRIRRLVRRLNLPTRDADMWTAIMRQIVWKLNAVQTPNPSEVDFFTHG
jgi:tRNA C32,U32 (ribose-2'-O)-methylase TrmJ